MKTMTISIEIVFVRGKKRCKWLIIQTMVQFFFARRQLSSYIKERNSISHVSTLLKLRRENSFSPVQASSLLISQWSIVHCATDDEMMNEAPRKIISCAPWASTEKINIFTAGWSKWDRTIAIVTCRLWFMDSPIAASAEGRGKGGARSYSETSEDRTPAIGRGERRGANRLPSRLRAAIAIDDRRLWTIQLSEILSPAGDWDLKLYFSVSTSWALSSHTAPSSVAAALAGPGNRVGFNFRSSVGDLTHFNTFPSTNPWIARW